MIFECSLCHSKVERLHPVSFTSSPKGNKSTDGILQCCDNCYRVLFE